MAEQIDLEQLPEEGPQGQTRTDSVELERLSEIPMEVSVELGRTHLTVGEALDLDIGSIVVLERNSAEPADLLINGTAIARGEVVVVDDKFALRVTEVIQPASEELEQPEGQNGASPAEGEQLAA